MEREKQTEGGGERGERETEGGGERGERETEGGGERGERDRGKESQGTKKHPVNTVRADAYPPTHVAPPIHLPLPFILAPVGLERRTLHQHLERSHSGLGFLVASPAEAGQGLIRVR